MLFIKIIGDKTNHYPYFNRIMRFPLVSLVFVVDDA